MFGKYLVIVGEQKRKRRKFGWSEKEKNNGEGKYILCRGEEKQRKQKIFGEALFFADNKKRGEGKGRRYLEKENIFFVEEEKTETEMEGNIWRREIYFLRRRRKRRKENISFAGERKQRRKRGKSFGEGKCHDGGYTDRRLFRETYIVKIELEFWTQNSHFIVDDKADPRVLLLNTYCIKIKRRCP